MSESAPLSDFFGDVISSYSRSQAIADGVLVPISPVLSKDAGILFPVCVTDSVWNGYIDPTCTHQLSQLPGQSVEGRLWDLLWMFRCAVRAGKDVGDRIRFSVLFQMEPAKEPVSIDLISVCGPGDMGEPVITIMLPGED